MQKILRKRILRDLKENLFRYLALSVLIILVMYLVVSIAGAADTIIIGSQRQAEKNKVEDGQFGVFVPLTRDEIKDLEDTGIDVEEQFYLDFAVDDGAVIRIYKNRENIDLIALEDGRLAKANDEIVLEKRYCEEHKIVVGDKIQLADTEWKVVGIGSTPDYDAPLKQVSDTSVDSSIFGTAFVTKDAYDTLKKSGKSEKAEEYIYAYHLNNKLTNDELKDLLKELDFNADDVNDVYFREYWDDTVGKKDELQDGIRKLADGSKELRDGLKELRDNNKDLNDGAQEIFDAYLKEANQALKGLSIKTLTEDNFETVLSDYLETCQSPAIRVTVRSLKIQLTQLKKFVDGTKEYTDGVAEASDGSEELDDGVQELKDETDEMIDELFDVDVSNLTNFMTADNNPRIMAAADDQVINRLGGLIAGVILMILFTYVISVFVVHSIENESSVIGALYALGITSKDLMLHYITLPVLVSVISSVIGGVLGFSRLGIGVQMQDCFGYFSLPVPEYEYTPYLILYTFIMPALTAAIVNCLVIRKKLARPVLSLLRKEQSANRIREINLGNMDFLARFRIRQMLREMRSAIALLFGLFVSLLIVMMGLDIYVMCSNVNVENRRDTKFEYMYTYKYPTGDIPDGGEEAFAKEFKKERLGYNLDVTLLGIHKGNPYFRVKNAKGRNEIVISTAVTQKYDVGVGDEFVVTDEETDTKYIFDIVGTTQYSSALYIFMDIDNMREFFGESDDYFNVVFSDHKLSIPSGRLYATMSKADVEEASGIFIKMMWPMIGMLLVCSVIIFCAVMYLMMKVMIDRSAYHISLVKIFGFRTKEVNRLYLQGNFYLVAVGSAICIPLAKVCMDMIYPLLIANVNGGCNLHFSWQMYLGIYAAIIVLYLLINQALVGRVKKMLPAEVLKNRE